VLFLLLVPSFLRLSSASILVAVLVRSRLYHFRATLRPGGVHFPVVLHFLSNFSCKSISPALSSLLPLLHAFVAITQVELPFAEHIFSFLVTLLHASPAIAMLRLLPLIYIPFTHAPYWRSRGLRRFDPGHLSKLRLHGRFSYVPLANRGMVCGGQTILRRRGGIGGPGNSSSESDYIVFHDSSRKVGVPIANTALDVATKVRSSRPTPLSLSLVLSLPMFW
jgi:hypothetical protein